MASPDQNLEATRELMRDVVDTAVTKIMHSDEFIDRLADAIAIRMGGSAITAQVQAEAVDVASAVEPYWEVTFDTVPANDDSFRVFVESGDDELTAANFQVIAQDGTDTTPREDVMQTMVKDFQASGLARGRLYWASLHYVTAAQEVAYGE